VTYIFIAQGVTALMKFKLEKIRRGRRRRRRNKEEKDVYLHVLRRVGETSVSQTVAVVPASKGRQDGR
jgi:hypothetical protein